MADPTIHPEDEQVARAVRWLSATQRNTLITGIGLLHTCTLLGKNGLVLGVEPVAGEGRSRWSVVLSPLGEAAREHLLRQGREAIPAADEASRIPIAEREASG